MEMNPRATLLLTRDDLRQLLKPADYLNVAETAFRAYAEGRVLQPALMHVDSERGEFHIKAGGLKLEHMYFALKSNGGFFENVKRYGLPPIQGVILLCDAENGYPLAIMESTAITLGRTAATTALAARHLARANAEVVTICGCGNQGAEHLRYLSLVRPVSRVFAWDRDQERAQRFATEMSAELEIEICPAADLRTAVQRSDICITCTPARAPFLGVDDVPQGMFVGAIGADSPDKQELDSRLVATSTLIVDIVQQCAAVGELHHALDANLMNIDGVHAELGDILIGTKRGRATDSEITIFDATGTALQDTAAAVAAYERACAVGAGRHIDFFSRQA